jgi:hypothetical protein
MSNKMPAEGPSSLQKDTLQISVNESSEADVTIPRITILNLIQNLKQKKMAVKDIVNDLEQLLLK